MSHNHTHSADINSRDEIMALLEYMAHHNESHANELSSLLDKMDFATDDAKKMMVAAIECYKSGNEKLSSAIKEIKGE